MRVTLSEHGGFAAGIRRAPFTVDATELEAAAAERLRELVAAAMASPTSPAGRSTARDAMRYTVTVSESGRAPVTLHASDADPGSPVAALVDWLQRSRTGQR